MGLETIKNDYLHIINLEQICQKCMSKHYFEKEMELNNFLFECLFQNGDIHW